MPRLSPTLLFRIAFAGTETGSFVCLRRVGGERPCSSILCWKSLVESHLPHDAGFEDVIVAFSDAIEGVQKFV